MAAMPSPTRIKASEFIKVLGNKFPELIFRPGNTLSWSPHDKLITYPKPIVDDSICWGLLHEVGHAILEHQDFKNDLDLIRIERDAWEKARELSLEFGIEIPSEHLEKCIDSYRDWLYARSLCPNCHQCGIQTDQTIYTCVFCTSSWKVSKSRLCRVSRRLIK